MTAFFSDMLLGRLLTDVPKRKGRLVSFSGPDIDIRLTTGSMRERVLAYLYLNGVPCMARDIAGGIKSNPSRVTKALKDMIEVGEVEAIKHEGCVMEYALTNLGITGFKLTADYLNLKD